MQRRSISHPWCSGTARSPDSLARWWTRLAPRAPGDVRLHSGSADPHRRGGGGPARATLLLTTHHLSVDGRSMAVLRRDLAVAYRNHLSGNASHPQEPARRSPTSCAGSTHDFRAHGPTPGLLAVRLRCR